MAGAKPAVLPPSFWTDDSHFRHVEEMQQKVLQLLENGADIEQRGGPDESSLLFVFVEKRKEALAKLLLGKGADVSTKTNTGETPLHAAAKAVDESMVRLLLAGGADVLAKTNSGDTPLHFAVEDWYTSLVLLLLEHGADASAKGEEGWTPLHIAVERGDEDMVALLLAHKADVTVTSNSGETPLHAISRGRGAARTAEQQENDGKDIAGEDTIHQIDATVVRMLVEHGADMSATSHDGSTPLHCAAEEGRIAVVRELLALGADASAKDNTGATPLHAVTRGGLKEVPLAEMRRLMAGVVEALQWEGSGEAPDADDVGLAADEVISEVNEGVIRLLVDHGADASAQTDEGETPLHFAVKKARYSTVRLLIDKGADVAILSNAGQTPEDVAAARSLDAIAEMLGTESLRRAKVAKCEAFAMGTLERLGAASRLRGLDTVVVRMVLQASDLLPREDSEGDGGWGGEESEEDEEWEEW